MKMTIAAIAAAAALAGCATPSEVRQDGTRTDWTLALPPQHAASCMARNAEEAWRHQTAQVRTLDASGYEVIVRIDTNTVAVANVTPHGTGSQATIWRNSMPILPSRLPEAMAKGC